MPPKQKITKESMIEAALTLIREQGEDALNARALAGKLACSTQPIFSNYESMEELKKDVIAAAHEIYRGYLTQEMTSGEYPVYKASGMGYIRFAKEECRLFQLLFMRDRRQEVPDDNDEELQQSVSIIQHNLGLSKEDATLLHLEMWVSVHGIAAMLATSYLEWDWDMISRMVTDIYQGTKEQFIKGK